MTNLLDRPEPTPVDRPRIDPRFARRWIDVRREQARRRMQILVAAGGLFASLGLVAGSFYTPLWAVRHLRVTVVGPVSAAAVTRLAGIGYHTEMIDVHGSSVAARLDADPWLGAAQVRRQWPGTVTLSVAVRRPLAVVAVPARGSAGGWAEVDGTGRVLADLLAPPPGLAQLSGVASVPSPGRWLADSAGPEVDPGAPPSALADLTAASDAADVPSGSGAALAALDSLPASLRADVSSIQAAPRTGLALVIAPPRLAAGTVTVTFGDGSELQAKITALVTLLDDANLSGVTGLDLSVPSRPAAITNNNTTTFSNTTAGAGSAPGG